MRSTEIIKTQLAKISTFIYLLVLLFSVNIIFNLNYQWTGISIIVKVYIFLLSFYIMYNFSVLDIAGLKKEYREFYGKKGSYILFFVTRVFPVLIIYCSVIFFTLIEDINLPHWPATSLIEIIGGRNSNIVFIAIVLLVLLKWKKGPGVTIPLFLGFALLHFILYKSVYRLLPLGIPVTGIKLVEFVLFLFFMIYEFNSEKKKIVRSVLMALMAGLVLYFSFIGVYSLIYWRTDYSSQQRVVVSRMLLKLGYSFPLRGFEETIRKTGKVDLLGELIFYARKYGQEIQFSEKTWKDLFVQSSMSTGENIARYIMKRNIELTYQRVVSYAEIKSVDDGRALVQSRNFIAYASRYRNQYDDLTARYGNGNDFFKIWVMKVISLPGNVDSVPFLVGELTGSDDLLMREAYTALKRITGLDPAAELKAAQNDSEVAVRFMKAYRQKGIRP